MTVEIRPARDSEMAGFRNVAMRTLLISPEAAPPGAIEAIRPEWTLCAFEDGELVTSYAWWPMNMRFNGTGCPVAGITFVGTHPARRRRGHLRRIVARHFEAMHESGERSIAVLHASRAAIYHRYGYAVVASCNTYCTEPRHLAFARPAAGAGAAGRLCEIEDERRDVLKDVYRRFCRDRTGYLHRARATWDAGALAPPPENGTLFKIVYEEDGVPMGYVVYSVASGRWETGRPDHRVRVRDLAWLSASAYFGICRHLSGLDLAGEILWPRVARDDPLPHLVCEPSALNIRTRDGLMGRIVDVPGAAAGRSYDAEGSLCFELLDELCPWNRGRWLLEAAGGRADVARTGRRPEIRLPVDTLAMLLFGQLSASRAAQAGLIEVLVPEALPLWDRLMQTRHAPFCPDFF